ncbi:MAG TPA: glycosyltransferase family 2 protein [Opitutaceae bacterium]|nr:glycosyltransferase family 2 protein [Opitutaceae bacterium]
MSNAHEFSIVIPFFNEEENVQAVLEEVRRAQPQAELVAVDDGSSDTTWVKIQAMPGVRGVRNPRNMGQSAAMFNGIMAATGAVIGTMDGDGQTDPADYAAMLEALRREKVDVVIGYRATREDTWSKRWASKFANRIRKAVLHDGARDTGCPMKIFRREARAALVAFNGMHRFMPALFRGAGFTVFEMPVRHRQRAKGVSKYTNWGRAWRGLYDLFGVRWLLKRRLVFREQG